MKHPDKTFIGKVERGFDFLGYLLKHQMVNVSISTYKRFAERICQLYEQGAEVGSVRADFVRIGEYVKRWVKWSRIGLEDSFSLLSCGELLHTFSYSIISRIKTPIFGGAVKDKELTRFRHVFSLFPQLLLVL